MSLSLLVETLASLRLVFTLYNLNTASFRQLVSEWSQSTTGDHPKSDQKHATPLPSFSLALTIICLPFCLLATSILFMHTSLYSFLYFVLLAQLLPFLLSQRQPSAVLHHAHAERIRKHCRMIGPWTRRHCPITKCTIIDLLAV